MKKVLVLGCTGSIGKSSLSIIRSNPDLFTLAGASAHTNELALLQVQNEFSCNNLCLSGKKSSYNFPFIGNEGLKQLIETTEADIVINGIAGAAGLESSIWTIKNNKNLALANKETIVMAGNLIQKLAKEHSVSIIPVDSEHSAIFSLINGFDAKNLDSIILTASGGPFRNYSIADLKKVTLEDALKHPTWNMGSKITIDSATLANKGLEVIEAAKLFHLPAERIQVVVHPQSIVHSLIKTNDGILYAQMSKPDMRHPIFNALTYPEIKRNTLEQLDFSSFTTGLELSFYPPRIKDFKMLHYAYEVVSLGGSYSIAYNAANEIAVDAFLKRTISFLEIQTVTEKTLSKDWSLEPKTFEDVLEIDRQARNIALGGIN